MPKRTIGLSDANARLHKNHSFELLTATWLMHGGWQVFAPLLDAAHGVDLIASDGPNSYRLQIKSVHSQNEHCQITNLWKERHIDFVIYFAQRSNWGYVCPAFNTNQKFLDDPPHKRFQQNQKSFLATFHTCERITTDNKSLSIKLVQAK
ncbi:MAG TPA: hypothetical protein VHG71_04205 [Verrucomicrobiae bacterium]|nr:hypothetical protein [Verrucomicrobiae bacterium]